MPTTSKLVRLHSCGCREYAGRILRCPIDAAEHRRELAAIRNERTRKSPKIGSLERCECGKEYIVTGPGQKGCKECRPERHRQAAKQWYQRQAKKRRAIAA